MAQRGNENRSAAAPAQRLTGAGNRLNQVAGTIRGDSTRLPRPRDRAAGHARDDHRRGDRLHHAAVGRNGIHLSGAGNQAPESLAQTRRVSPPHQTLLWALLGTAVLGSVLLGTIPLLVTADSLIATPSLSPLFLLRTCTRPPRSRSRPVPDWRNG